MGSEALHKTFTVNKGRENHYFILFLFVSKNCKLKLLISKSETSFQITELKRIHIIRGYMWTP
jgi:hypothetical protein